MKDISAGHPCHVQIAVTRNGKLRLGGNGRNLHTGTETLAAIRAARHADAIGGATKQGVDSSIGGDSELARRVGRLQRVVTAYITDWHVQIQRHRRQRGLGGE